MSGFSIPNRAQLRALVAFTQIYVTQSVNFNAGNTDTLFTVPALPVGLTRFLVVSVRISGASGTLTTATAGLFTAAAGGGTAIVTAASAITVSTASEGAANNTQAMAINNANAQTFLASSVPTLYFRVATAQGVAATGSVLIAIAPVL